MWPLSTSSSSTRTTPLISYGGLSHTEMGMFVVAPATSFHHTSTHDALIPFSASSDLHHPLASSNAVSSAATALGVGVIPFLTAAPYDLNMGGGSLGDGDLIGGNRSRPTAVGAGAGGMQLWQGQQQPNHYQQANYLKMGTDTINFDQGSSNLLASGSGARGGGGGGSFTCQDCGNQAKKDCSHRRCRTCCKSRGFDCSTHLKSTWVSAARRRERQNMAVVGVHGGGGASSGSTSGAIKKPRLSQNTNTTTSHTSTSNNTPPRSFDTSSSQQDGSFKESLPGQVRAPAVFRCVRVTAIDDGGEPEFAYQAVVKINGHVFKGFLYDQGRVDRQSRDSFPSISELHLGGGGAGSSSSGGGGGGGGREGGSSPPLDASTNIYVSAAGGLYGGRTFGNAIN